MNDREPREREYGGKLDLSLYRKLFRYVRPHRRAAVLLVLSGVGTAAADTAFGLVTRSVIDDAVEKGRAFSIFPWIGVYAGLIGLLCFCVWGFIRLAGEMRSAVSHDIRRDGFAKLQELSFSFYDKHPVGWLMARMTSDCDRLSNVYAWGILDITWGVTLLTFLGGVMIWIDAKLALLVMAVVPFVAWMSAVFRRRILRTARTVRKTNSKITSAYNEGIMGVTTSKVFVREQENLDDFRGLSTRMFEASVRNALLSALFLPLVLTLGSVATGLALAAGGFDVISGGITVGTLILFITYSRQFFDPIQELAHWFAELQMAQASAERILWLLDTEPEVRDSEPVRVALTRSSSAPPRPGIAADGHPEQLEEIEFRGVGFSYGDGPRVLQDFDLRVRAGTTIALVGRTGGGKTTIVNLLCRFYEPVEGEILLDGIDYRKRSLSWLQGNLGIVLQEPHLFSGTVADNIRYGKLDATDSEVRAAARLVGAHDFISAAKGGYATEVGEGGVRLSTGQKQLVSFARAILARPRILVMDEATSSVDTETEMRIQTGLARVLSGRTSFIIAHRLSTIRSADRILVIEGGRIAEQGAHRELLTSRGRYFDLYRQQSLVEEVKSGRSWAR